MRVLRTLAISLAIFGAAAASLHAQANPSGAQSAAVRHFATQPAQELLVTSEFTTSLDSRTAKAGDRITLKTKSVLRLDDGTEIPKGAKLIGHITGAKAAGGGDANAQIALAFDRLEWKDEQSVTVQGEFRSIVAPGGDSGGTDAMAPTPGGASAGRAPGDMYGSTPTLAPPSQVAREQTPSASTLAARVSPGQIVAHSGDLAIRTTSIPGLLLANHEPDSLHNSSGPPSSSILLGAARDIHLESETRAVIAIASAGTAQQLR